MPSRIRIATTAGLALLALAGLPSCSKESKVARHVSKAETYRAEGDIDRAEIEFLNALKESPVEPKAVAGLGQLYFDTGAVARSIPYIIKARELLPEDITVRLRHAMMAVAMGERLKAREDLLFVLQKDPKNPEAPLYLVDTISSAQELAETRQILTQLPGGGNQTAPTLTALGLILLREGKGSEAETLFRRAITVDPKFDVPYVPLTALALQKNNRPEAEAFAKKASEFAPEFSSRRIHFAQYKLQAGDIPGARAEVEAVLKKTPSLLSARTLLANILAAQGQGDDAVRELGVVIGRDPINPEALLMRARVLQFQGKLAESNKDLERVLARIPTHQAALLQQANLLLAQGETNKAMASLMKALNANPDNVDAALLLSELYLREDKASESLLLIGDVLKKRPKFLRARLLQAEVFRTQGRVEDARAILLELEKEFPTEARYPLLRGGLEMQANNLALARAAFELAYTKSNQGIGVLEQLTDLDIRENKAKDAEKRIREFLAKGRNESDVYLLLARALSAQQINTEAEAALREAIRLNPDNRLAYLTLARLYAGTNQAAKAVENLGVVLKQNPKDTAAWMLKGTLHEEAKQYDEARQAYEKLLEVNPRFAAALNNLAYLYSERFNRLEEAQALATRAREVQPNFAVAADTLGWILYRQGKYAWALGLVKEAADAFPQSGEVQYHMGMIHYMLGNETEAVRALSQSIELEAEFLGREEAVEKLAFLRSAPTGNDLASIEKALSAKPGDPIALGRLGQHHLNAGNLKEAAAAFERLQKASPESPRALRGLAQIRLVEKDYTKAVELIQAARKTSPDDPDLSALLGVAAWGRGDGKYAYSVLVEAARRLPDDALVQGTLGWAAFSQGRLAEASTAWGRALTVQPNHPQATAWRDAQTLVQPLLDLASAQTAASASLLIRPVIANSPNLTSLAQRLLEKDAKHVPALMWLGVTERDANSARGRFETALSIYPDFVPAMRELALLTADSTADATKANEWASKAREANAQDARVAAVLGCLALRRGDANRAATLLSEAATSTSDPRVHFLLGKARVQAKATNAKAPLEKALALGLSGTEADEARELLKK